MLVRTGDVLTIALDRRVRVLKVLDFAERRGAAGGGAALYEDLSAASGARPPTKPRMRPAVRDPGAGRPTKRDRRAWARFTGGERTLTARVARARCGCVLLAPSVHG